MSAEGEVGTSRRPAGAPAKVDIFDTTLRDGAQFEGISLTVDDKLRVAEQLDWLGVRWIEGGYPQANPRDAEFFRRAPRDLRLDTATLVAFGSTRRPAGRVDVDPTLAALVESGVSTACIVGKSWDFHVTEALGTSLDEGVAMVGDSVRFLRAQGLRPIQIWVPDVRAPSFRAEARRQSLAVAASAEADADQAFIDAVSATGPDRGDG